MLSTRKKLVASLVLFSLLVPVAAIHAQTNTSNQFQNPLDPSGSKSANTIIRDIITRTIVFILGLAGMVALVVLVYAGLRLILGSALGEAEIARAKTMIMWAIIGLVVVGLAAAILRTIRGILF